ncbi:MAG: flagellar hook-basal body complex protein FliE [Legionella sp.]|nr:MAG: flagellar hook-basal body complex protein FliE [Legionella sp.]PJD96966.1 MAG: flagellar hook-basal body complex protein FliE [Legionella sp.]
MSVEPISSLMLSTPSMTETRNHKTENTFSTWLGSQIMETNNQLNAADQALNDLASGKSTNLHQTMITMEQAKLSFQYLEQIRNRLMSAYQELLREPI